MKEVISITNDIKQIMDIMSASINKAVVENLNRASFDRTYTGIISEVLFNGDTDKNDYYYGKYKVVYNNTEQIFAINDGFVHKVGDKVKVYIPLNNISNRYAEAIVRNPKIPEVAIEQAKGSFDFYFYNDGHFETNFEALDVTQFPPTDYIRRFIRISGENIYWMESKLQPDEPFDFMASPRGESIYWTEIEKKSVTVNGISITWTSLDEPPFKRGTVIDPLQTHKITFPSGITSSNKEALMTEIKSMYRVKTRKTAVNDKGQKLERIIAQTSNIMGSGDENELLLSRYFYPESINQFGINEESFSGIRLRKEAAQYYDVNVKEWLDIGTGGEGGSRILIERWI